MSKINSQKKIRIHDIVGRKAEGKKLSMVTCYDASFSRLVDRSEVDMILVGDSLGNVMMGFDDTIPVTVDHMVHHTACVTRVAKRPFIVADMPFMSYATVEDALSNAKRLIQEGGAAAVKLEGGSEISQQVSKLTSAGIPVCGHLGLTPQSVHAQGGYRVQGRTDHDSKQMIEDALALEKAGVFCVVLELIPADLAEEITKCLKVPTIGIGAGSSPDGQVLVLQDLLGFDSGFNPKFLKKYANLEEIVSGALNAYDEEVKNKNFPAKEQGF